MVRHLDAGLKAFRRTLLPPELVVFEDATAPWLASALGTICELELAEKIPLEGGISFSTLSHVTEVSPSSLQRLLKVVASHGYFSFSEDGSRISHTRLSRALLRGRGGQFCRLQASSWYRDCFAADQVAGAMRGERTPFESKAEQQFFDFVQVDTEKARLFHQAMAEITRFCAPFLANSLPFSRQERVLDVGGGNGELCRLLRPYFDDVSFTVLDLEEQTDPSDGLSYFTGNFFQEVPSGFDHLLLKNILHDWDDDTSRQILQNCRRASLQGATKLTLLELVLPSGWKGGPISASDFCVDWNVYCTLGGRERTLEDYDQLLADAGWKRIGFSLTPTPLCILKAEAV